jgi:hypothetical protein
MLLVNVLRVLTQAARVIVLECFFTSQISNLARLVDCAPFDLGVFVDGALGIGGLDGDDAASGITTVRRLAAVSG